MLSAGSLDIRHLAALAAVATEGTFGRAAARLGYTQSAVSQQIAGLERQVGAPVFDRPGGPRPVTLTPLGELLLGHAVEILDRVETAAAAVERFRAGDIGRIDVGTFQSVSIALLPGIVRHLTRLHPEVEIHLHETDDCTDLYTQLDDGQVDITFVDDEPGPAYAHRRLVADPFVLLAPHGEFAPGAVAISDLVGRAMIGQRDNPCQLLNEKGLRSNGCDPNYVFRTDDNGAVIAMVRAGLGLAVLPLLCVESTGADVAVHPLDPMIPSRVVSLAWRPERTLSPVAAAFIDMADDLARDLERTLTATTGDR